MGSQRNIEALIPEAKATDIHNDRLVEKWAPLALNKSIKCRMSMLSSYFILEDGGTGHQRVESGQLWLPGALSFTVGSVSFSLCDLKLVT